MAANFGFTEEYVDNEMDMDSLFAHLDYLNDNPPIGGLFKGYLEAKYGGKKRDEKSYISNDPQQQKRLDQAKFRDLSADFGVDITQLQKRPKRKIRKIIVPDDEIGCCMAPFWLKSARRCPSGNSWMQ